MPPSEREAQMLEPPPETARPVNRSSGDQPLLPTGLRGTINSTASNSLQGWRGQHRTCACGVSFTPKRAAQVYCSVRCRDADAKRRKRRSMDKNPKSEASHISIPRSMDTPVTGQSPLSEWPRCHVCGKYDAHPPRGWPPILFCMAVRRGRRHG